MRRLKEKIIFALLALALATSAAAHVPPPELAPAIDLRHQATAQELVQSFPVFAGTTAFEELARIELPPPSLAAELAHRFAAGDVRSRSDLAIFDRTVSRKLASGPLAAFEENNVNELNELGPELRRAIEFQALPFHEPATGLVYARARWYDPGTGSFLSPDPLGYQDSSNLYAFCAGDPVNCSDPTGQWGIKDAWNQAKENTIFAAGLLVGAGETVIEAVNNLNPIVGTTRRVKAAIPRAKRVAAAYRAGGTGAAARQYGAEVKDYVKHNAPIISTIVHGQGIVDTYYREGAFAAGRHAGSTWVGVTSDALLIYAGGRGVEARLNAAAEAAVPENLIEIAPLSEAQMSRARIVDAPLPGGYNPATRAASARGRQLHADRPGNLPDQFRQRYPDSMFKFRGKGQDIEWTGGVHPSAYPGSAWPKGVNYGDFKPDTVGGRRTFRSDQRRKWTEPTVMVPYDPATGQLQ